MMIFESGLHFAPPCRCRERKIIMCSTVHTIPPPKWPILCRVGR